ncbi:MAG: iron uptake porin [Thermosynechococcaceae cyanobacterium]
MSTQFWSRLLLSTLLLSAAGLQTKALAEQTPTVSALEGQTSRPVETNVHLTPLFGTDETQSSGQVTSVSQLSDVQPTDWAFQALQSLVERYGCIAGYPDGTFRGNRAATRYELAAALNACLDQISDRFATKEDLATVKALQEEFKAELATLKGRVDGLEARTATLEAQQFSTTTKLKGEAVFIASQVFDGGTDAPGDNGNDTRPVFSNRVRLNFDTSFSGKDQLRIRLQARNIETNNIASGTNMTRLSVDGNENNTFTVDDLFYKFPIGKKGKFTAFANSADFYSQVNTFNPYLASDGTGSISRFGRFNPIYRLSERSNSAGVVFNYKFTDKIGASLGYVAASPTSSVGPTGGLFGGSYTALAQLELQPTKNLAFGVAYAHTFQEEGLVSLGSGTGSAFSSNPFANAAPGISDATNADSVGLQFTWKVVPKFNISGWAGYTRANYDGNNAALQGAKADIINWSAQFAFPDLFMKGNLGAIVIGQQPYVFNKAGNATFQRSTSDPDSNFHIEGLYRFQVNDNISVTPGVIVIINPENNASNDADFVPVIRTTFTF